MTDRDYAIKSMKEITFQMASHAQDYLEATIERHYTDIKKLMTGYQKLILENQIVLEELDMECQEKINEDLLKCSDARTNGDPVCRSLVIRREPLEENILGLVHQYAASMLEKEKKVSSNRQCDYKEINTAELQKQSRQLTSEKMKLYDDYKDGRIDRDSYKQRAGKISVQLEEIKRKIEDAENSKKLLEQNELSDKIKLKDFLGIQKFDTEKLREIIKVIRVHSQDEIEIEWNFDDTFSEQR